MSTGTNSSDLSKLPASYRDFYFACTEFIPEIRIYSDPLRTLAFGTDASVYRLTPKLVVKVRSGDEVARILGIASQHAIPVTFRAAGTSLSGQAVTDSVLLVLAGGWSTYSITPDGKAISLEPGIIGSEANAYLKSFSRKIGPAWYSKSASGDCLNTAGTMNG